MAVMPAVTDLQRRKQGRSLAVVAVVVSLLVLGLSATWAVHGVRALEREQRRTRSSRECRHALKYVYQNQKSFFQEKDRYSENPRETGLSLEPGNRVVLVFSRARSNASVASIIGVDEKRRPELSTAALLARLPASAPVGVSGACPDCEMQAVCISEVQLWSVATFSRTLPDGGVIAAGVPILDSSEL